MRIALFLFTIITLSSCQTPTNPPLTAEDIIQKSIKYHDPKGNFNELNARFYFESAFSWNDSIPEELVMDMDFKNYALVYRNLDREMELEYQKDTCFTHKGETSCRDFIWAYDFYLYIWGLPMKLSDPGIDVKDTVYSIHHKGKELKAIDIEYETEYYSFYFDSLYALNGFQFIKKDNPEKGEQIWLEGVIEHEGIKFPKKRVWYDLKNNLLGTNECVKTEGLSARTGFNY